jgi:hypothetical protein
MKTILGRTLVFHFTFPIFRGLSCRGLAHAPSSYSGVTGIYWDTERFMWRVQLYYQNRKMEISRFDFLEDAKRALNRVKAIYNDSRRIPPRPQQTI